MKNTLRPIRFTALGLTITVLLVACSMGPPETDAEGMLVPGGSYVDNGGIVIGALPGATESQVGVSVRSVAEPEFPLPGGAKAVGDFQRISATKDVYGAGNPFAIAVPVAAGADPGALALAVLLEPGDMTDTDEHTGAHWQLLEGVYDPEEGFFITTIALLAASGRTVVLVQAPGWQAPELSPNAAANATIRPQQAEGEFHVSCRRFDDAAINNRGITCSETDENDLERALEDAFADYRGLGFELPYLLRRIDLAASSFEANSFNLVFGEYLAELRPFRDVDEGDDTWSCGVEPDGSGNLGGYSSSSRTFFVCIGAGGVGDTARDTARHEYFHATQYGYASVRSSNQTWVIESTATVSERTLVDMARDPSRGLRDVDAPLTATDPGTIEYQTQDFFIYTGVRLGLGLDYLIDVFEEGASTANVHDALGPLGLNGGIPALYWAWAKNQAFEAQFDLGAAELGSSCSLTTGTAVPVPVTYRHLTPPGTKTVNLPPLTSAVLEIDFEALPDADYTTSVSVEELGVGDPSDIKVKFYDAADAGTTSCWAAPEAKQIDVTVSAGQTRTLYALVSNLQVSASAGARFTFGSSELAIEIVTPASGATFTESDDVEFLSVATGLGDQDPGTTPVKWTYSRSDETPFSFFSTNGEAVTHKFCDGTYTVVAEVVDADTQGVASDSVTFTVSNSSPPPALCAPSIDILTPNDGDTFALGESVTFEAVMDDDHPETDDPLFPVVWRDGGPSGLIIAQDTLTFSRDKFTEGVHQIYVEYGTASDSVTIEIVDTANTAPNATIINPADGAQFSYLDLGASPQVDFSGSGSDAEDGALGSSSLTWSYLREGSVEWQDAGTGASFTLLVSYGSDNVTTYRVRLRATDSDGLFDVHEIEISILNPPI